MGVLYGLLRRRPVQVETGQSQGQQADRPHQRPGRNGMGVEIQIDIGRLVQGVGVGGVGNAGLHIGRKLFSGGHKDRGRSHGHAVEHDDRLRVLLCDLPDPVEDILPVRIAHADGISVAQPVSPQVGDQDVHPVLFKIGPGIDAHGGRFVLEAVHADGVAVALLRSFQKEGVEAHAARYGSVDAFRLRKALQPPCSLRVGGHFALFLVLYAPLRCQGLFIHIGGGSQKGPSSRQEDAPRQDACCPRCFSRSHLFFFLFSCAGSVLSGTAMLTHTVISELSRLASVICRLPPILRISSRATSRPSRTGLPLTLPGS